MSVKTSKKNPDQVKEKPKKLFSSFNVQIQCPDCGDIFVLHQEDQIFCSKCERIFTENEIRKRCGL